MSREINPWKSFDLLLGSNLRPLAPSAECLTARRSIFLEQPLDVISCVNKLKPKSSAGHDGFYTKILKETIINIIEPITHIINQSFNMGVFPNEMKITKVIPIFKNAEKNL